MRRRAWRWTLAAGLVAAGAGCASAQPARDSALVRWASFRHLHGVVDLGGPRRDGRFVVPAAGRLFLWRPGRAPTPFARGPNGFKAGAGDEPYLVVSPGSRMAAARCSFPRDYVYAVALGPRPGVVTVDPRGRARRFASLPTGTGPRGIALDTVGGFGRRLLVIAAVGDHSDVFALDCRGHVRTLTRSAPKLEGGIVVAPPSFGAYGGQLIAPDEFSGRIFAIDVKGAVRTVADSGLPTGGDIGVESAGFVPAGASAAFVADRASPGSPTVGTDSILRLGRATLARAGVAAGDLLVASEGGARTIAVRCAASCTVRHVADGPAAAHGEGHIAFTR